MSESDPVAARVCRRGTAIEIEYRGGRRRTLRARELQSAVGRLDVGSLVSARARGAAVEIELAGGGTEAFEIPTPSREVDLVIRGARSMTCEGDGDDPLGLAADSAIAIGGGAILWHGPDAEVERAGLDLDGARRIDARGRLVTPGLIDCHAHPLFDGDRAGEFAMRARGADYREIAATGGGIRATVGPTRAASFADHVAATTGRARRALAAGTTTLEAKSGYDLSVDGELRLLEVALVVDSLGPIDISPTLLGAHVIPAERAGDRDGYVADVAERMVPAAAAAGLAESVDVYCDEGAFTLAETRTILEAADRAGLGVRAHVGQFADLGGAELLAELGARSADHLEEISATGIAALAAHGVVAVMLPAACVQLRQKPPPVAALRAAGVTLAVATDMNPGTSYCETLAVPMWLATTHYGMTVEETWLGVTRHAARALGRHDVGTLTVGGRADLVLWETDQPADIPYRFTTNLATTIFKSGHAVT